MKGLINTTFWEQATNKATKEGVKLMTEMCTLEKKV